MRIVVLGAASPGLGEQLAEHLHLEHVLDPAEITSDTFLLNGAPRTRAEAVELDALLHRRGAEIDSVLWVGHRLPFPDAEIVLNHYAGRVVELDATEDGLRAALDGLREAHPSSP